MEIENKKKKLVQFLLENNVLIEPDFLEQIKSTDDLAKLSELINQKIYLHKVEEKNSQKAQTERGTVKVNFSYKEEPRKITAQDFINYFNARYASIKKMLQQRQQLENVVSIGKLKAKKDKEQVSVIGMVYEKEETKNGIMITIEDQTGHIKVFFSKNKIDLLGKAKDVVFDEIIGVTGTSGNNIIFANDLYFPEIPMTKEIKKSPTEDYVLFLSDVHLGSKQFLEEEFLKFIKWIQGDLGNEKQKEIASKVKYIFITGDLVDGISVYPTQKEDLAILTYKEQYKKFVEFLRLIPNHIQIIISPGNHDVVFITEPQPPLPREYCEELWQMPNVTMVSNPAIVNIGANESFPGFDVLIYHGYSYNYYADKVESIRAQKQNISERADAVMKLLLTKRHLAPTYDANPHMPTDIDYMIIEKVPDIFISGDVHRSAVFTFRGVTTGIISSCFQSQTSFQEKVGHVPDPGRVPIMNLKTRDVKILNFSGASEDK